MILLILDNGEALLVGVVLPVVEVVLVSAETATASASETFLVVMMLISRGFATLNFGLTFSYWG
jgi:hypothetical protein